MPRGFSYLTAVHWYISTRRETNSTVLSFLSLHLKYFSRQICLFKSIRTLFSGWIITWLLLGWFWRRHRKRLQLRRGSGWYSLVRGQLLMSRNRSSATSQSNFVFVFLSALRFQVNIVFVTQWRAHYFAMTNTRCSAQPPVSVMHVVVVQPAHRDLTDYDYLNFWRRTWA